MIVYHGVQTKEIYDKVLKEGIRISKNGAYGAGIYCSSDYNLAADYSRASDYFKENQEPFVIPIELEDDDIIILHYSELAKRCGIECNEDTIFNRAKPIIKAEDYCKKEHISVLLVKYKDTDEVIIYEPRVIKKIGWISIFMWEDREWNMVKIVVT